MIVDTSALVAIIKREHEAPAFIDRLAKAIRTGERVAISAANLFELSLVIDRLKDPGLSQRIDALLEVFHVVVVDVTRRDIDLARIGNSRFGKGRHPAKLNFGDCFAYALAKQTGEPLLFKGNDFAQTDVVSAV